MEALKCINVKVRAGQTTQQTKKIVQKRTTDQINSAGFILELGF